MIAIVKCTRKTVYCKSVGRTVIIKDSVTLTIKTGIALLGNQMTGQHTEIFLKI